MIVKSLGLIRVPTPGTPVQVTTDDSVRASQILVRIVPGFTGRTYLGVAGMNKNAAGMSGVVRVLAEPASFGSQDEEAIPNSPNLFGNSLRVSDFYVDADVADEGLLVSYIET